MFCKNCGHQNNEHAAFCVKCGQKIDTNTQSSLPKLDKFQPTSAKQVIETRKNQHKQKKKSISFIIGGVVVLAVLGFFFVTKGFGFSRKNMNPLEMIYVGIDEVTETQGFDFNFVAKNQYDREEYSGSIDLGKNAESSKLSFIDANGNKLLIDNNKATYTDAKNKTESEDNVVEQVIAYQNIDLNKYIVNKHLDKEVMFDELMSQYTQYLALASSSNGFSEDIIDTIPNGNNSFNLFSDFIKNGLNDKDIKEKVFLNIQETAKNKYEFEVDTLELVLAFETYLNNLQENNKTLKEIGISSQDIRTLSSYIHLGIAEIQKQIKNQEIDPTIFNPYMTVSLDSKNRLTEFSVDSITDEEYDVDIPFMELTISNINKPSFN